MAEETSATHSHTFDIHLTIDLDAAAWADEYAVAADEAAINAYYVIVGLVARFGARGPRGLFTVRGADDRPTTTASRRPSNRPGLTAQAAATPERLQVVWDELRSAYATNRDLPPGEVSASEQWLNLMVRGYCTLVGVPTTDVWAALALGVMVPLLPEAPAGEAGVVQ